MTLTRKAKADLVHNLLKLIDTEVFNIDEVDSFQKVIAIINANLYPELPTSKGYAKRRMK